MPVDGEGADKSGYASAKRGAKKKGGPNDNVEGDEAMDNIEKGTLEAQAEDSKDEDESRRQTAFAKRAKAVRSGQATKENDLDDDL